MRTRAEIEEQIDKTLPSQERGRSKWPGMPYEEGVDHALRWALGDEDVPPMDGDDIEG